MFLHARVARLQQTEEEQKQSFPPERRQEKHKNREEFEAADEHFERGQQFRGRTQPVEIACRTNLRRAGTDIAQIGNGDRQSGLPGAVPADSGNQQGKDQDDADVGGEECDGFLDGGFLHADVVQVDAGDELREDVVLDFGQALPPDQQSPDAFEAARGRTAASADQGNPQNKRNRDMRPRAVVSDRKSGGCHDGRRLERRVAERLSNDSHGFDETLFSFDMIIPPLKQQRDRNNAADAREDRGVYAEFLVTEI